MTNDERYNGWTNRETWAVALWIDNDHGWQESVLSDVREAMADAKDQRAEGDLPEWSARLAASYAGDAVKENVESLLLDEDNDALGERDIINMLHDIGSLWRVDWTEVGAHYADQIAENMCSSDDCGAMTDDGEGWDGKCGSCADKAENDVDNR